jgi:DNA-binding NarL/FixJ family response regulator
MRRPAPGNEDATMQADRVSVVILYHHPLFGEGIAHLLASEPDMTVRSVASTDPDSMATALATHPDVVIFERGVPDTAVEVLRVAPDALVIDIDLNPGPTFTYHREEIGSRPDGIVAAIRGAGAHGHAAVVGALALAVAGGITVLPG